ncbi:uncharacterized protein LOC126668218 [Mercurialis annua]|uniref:uncharacterized protein LOC126668218 n=1 Tax=Mercurialis annua TaxID=3986 RepID=UPI00215FF5F5|nr:uncharacterized protein LOC126668218 [Mercurialis annua]
MDVVSHKDMFAVGAKPAARISYAATVAKSIQNITDCVETPVNKGGYIAITINQEVYEQQIAMCQNALIARIILYKGESPWKLVELKKKLTEVWGIQTSWKLISLGRGYYQKTTNSQIWVRFYKLPWEYWHPKILTSIAKGIGAPLKIDNATSTAEFGHYARILIDVDLSTSLPESLLIEQIGKSFFIDVVYENLPAFCSSCSNIGHFARECRLNIDSAHKDLDKPVAPTKTWKPKNKSSDILIDNVFKHLQSDLQRADNEIDKQPQEEIFQSANGLDIQLQEKITGCDETNIELIHDDSIVDNNAPSKTNLQDIDEENNSMTTNQAINEAMNQQKDVVDIVLPKEVTKSWADKVEEDEAWTTVTRRKTQVKQDKYKVTLSRRNARKPDKLNL